MQATVLSNKGRFTEAWLGLADRLELTNAVAKTVLSDLDNAYAEPHRHYHTADHIVALLKAMASLDFSDRATVELAVFFHDAVYDPARGDNESRSAALMRERLASNVGTERLDKAARMIEATKAHMATGDADTDLLLDLDMAIIGQPWSVYETYARGVMAEYEPVFGHNAYCVGRVKMFIEPMLGKSDLFLTPDFTPLQAQARSNLQRERTWLLQGAP